METLDLTLRAANAADRQAVVAICRQIWPETDHLPDYWSRLMSDQSTLARVIEVGGQVAAVAFLDLKEVSAWWHSVRVAPAFQRLGLATRLLNHFMDESRRRGVTRLRFAAGRNSESMQRLADRQGFRLLSRHRYVCAGPLSGAEENPLSVGPLKVSDLERVAGFLHSSVSWRAGHHTTCSLWVWDDVTRDSLFSMLEAGTVYGSFEGDRIEGIALTNQDRDLDYTWLFLSRIDGSSRSIQELGRLLRRLVSFLKPDLEECPVQGMVLDDPATIEALTREGYRFFPEEDMDLFELIL